MGRMTDAGMAATLLSIAGLAGPAPAQDLASGEALYRDSCRNCHGPTAKGMASFPKLAGHDAAWLTERLNAYRAGEKIGPNTALMAPMAVDLTDEDIAGVVAYIVETFD